MPAFTDYPEFVPDQVLTSDHLNNLFDYLDEQERMTRANLLGIGIVCGLEVKTESNVITVTKGVGVTSAGYLIRQETDKQYRAFKPYDTAKKEYYEKFVHTELNPVVPKFELFELRENVSDDPENNVLSGITGGLGEYVVLLFVELLQDQSKNCDPNSCDDKGINVTATVKPLLVAKALPAPFTDSLKGKTGNPADFNPSYQLPEVKMPRYNVPATSLVTSESVLSVYPALLSDAFLTTVQDTLSNAYTVFAPLLGGGSNPFTDVKQKFNFLRNVTTRNQLFHLQYHYDIIGDLLQAYDEFRRVGNGILSLCCPDQNLFPRHLLLGEAVPTATLYSANRHYFIYSPLFEKKNLVFELRFLMTRLETLKNRLAIPPFVTTPPAPLGIKVTPSQLNASPLSQKAIPYYYAPSAVYPVWNFEKTISNKATQNLSYHGETYGTDDFVKTPLRFDLEPYNFLRIEGHAGRQWAGVMQELQSQKSQNRLPIDIVALRTGTPDATAITDAVASCDIKDLQITYELVRREWEATIGKMIEYTNIEQPAKRALLDELSVGEDVYGNYRQIMIVAKTFMVPDLKQFISRWDAFLHPVYEKVESDSKLIRDFLFERLEQKRIKPDQVPLAEDFIDHCDEVLLSCLKGGFRAIHQQFESRLNDIYSQLYFSYFVQKHPGIQHKAGVPMGGTFILVYHQTPRTGTFNGPFVIEGIATSSFPMIFGRAVALGPNGAEVANAIIDISSRRFSLRVNSLPVNIQVEVLVGGLSNIFTPILRAGNLQIDSPSQVLPPLQTQGGPAFSITVRGETPNVYASLKDGEVIADFYLPYLCSSNCAPIQFVIQTPVNKAPVANAGLDQRFALPQTTTTLDGSGSSDPEGKPLTFLWSLVSAQQGVQFSDTSAAKVDVSGLAEPGQYVFQLTVSDGESSASDQVTITVDPPPNQRPTAVATASKENIALGETVTLIGSTSSDPENKPLLFAWTKLSGGSNVHFDNPSAAETLASNFTASGLHTFRLTVTDDGGLTATDDVNITVAPPNQPPVADAGKPVTGGPLNLRLPASFIQLDGTRSHDPEGSALKFSWKNAGALPLQIANAKSARPVAFHLIQTGVYAVELTVTDDTGQTGTDKVNIVVQGDRRKETCAALTDIETSFQPFNNDNNPVFLKLKDAFPALVAVRAYFNQLAQKQIASQSFDKQLAFFHDFRFDPQTGDESPTGGGVTIVEAVQSWLKVLFAIYQTSDDAALRALALQFYAELISLVAYIACIQRDNSANSVDVLEAVKLVGKQTNLPPGSFANLSGEELLQWIMLRALVDDEIFLIETTNQVTFKQDYLHVLTEIRKQLDILLNF